MFGRVFFFQGEFLGGNFGLVFQQCFHSSWRTGAALLSLVNKKAKPQFPAAGQTLSCWEGAPCGGAAVEVVVEGAVVCFPVFSLMQKPAYGRISGLLSKAPFHEFIDCTYTAACVKMLH